MIVRAPQHPEVPAPDDLATRRLAVQLRRALLLAVKAVDTYLADLEKPRAIADTQQQRVPARHETPGNGPRRPRERPQAARASKEAAGPLPPA